MTKPNFSQFFESFRGKDELGSPLGRGLDSATEFKNIEKLPNGSIRARQGLKVASQPLQVIHIYPYTYLDSSSVTQEELIGLASFDYKSYDKYLALVKLVEDALVITYTGAHDWSYSVTNTENNIVLTITENSVVVLTANLGSGYSSSDKKLQTLADEITALTNFSASVPHTAIVNGNQAAVTTITVDAGHTFALGDMTYFVDTTVNHPYERIAEITNTAATTITINTDSVFTDVTVTDNQIIGHGRYPAAILELASETTGSSSTLLRYTSWEPVKTLIDGLYLGQWGSNRYQTLPSFENKRNCLYFTAPYLKRATASFKVQIGDLNYEAGVWKYDGLRYYLSGNMSDAGGNLTAVSAGAGTGVDLGLHRYQASLKWSDAQGNEFEFFMPRYTDLTLVAAVNVNIQLIDLDNVKREFNRVHAKLTAATVSSNLLTITSGHKIRTGDYVYFQDTISTFLVRRKVVSYTLTTITVEGSAVSVANGDRVGNVALRIWRTKTGGTTQLLAFEKALHLPSGAETYVDTTSDATLGIIKSSVEPTNIQYPFPRGFSVHEHQGALCSAYMQTVYWEDPDSPEFSPTATNNTDVPSGVGGEISSLVSVDEGLYALKDTSIYNITGSLTEGSVETVKVVENSFGVQCPVAATVVDTVLIGVGRLGIFAHQNGSFVKGFGKEFLNIFRNIEGYYENYQIVLSKIVVFHDAIKNWVHIYIPYERVALVASTEPYYTIDAYSRHLVYMISPTEDQPSCWAEFEYYKAQQANAGFAIMDNAFYQQSSLSLSGVGVNTTGLVGFLHKRLDTNSVNDYLDNTRTYDIEYISAWDDADEPKSYKFWNDFVAYQVQPDFFLAAFTLYFESYRDWDLTKVDSIRTSSLSFSASTDTEKTLQLDKGHKAQRRAFKLSATVSKNPPIISGYEYTVDDNAYKKDRMVKNG